MLLFVVSVALFVPAQPFHHDYIFKDLDALRYVHWFLGYEKRYLAGNSKCRFADCRFSVSTNVSAQAKSMFFYGFNGYMDNAYPADELKPISCKPRERPDGENESAAGIDLVMGRYQLTLIDSLDTLYIMDEKDLWRKYVKMVIETVKFDANLDVSVFEASIRIVGGLLTNHIFAVREGMDYEAAELLRLTEEIAARLLPAFSTPTGLPVSKINLRARAPPQQSRDVCTACAGTYMLEFGLLSRLTGNFSYAEAALKSLMALDKAASKTNFMGAQVNVDDYSWSYTASGVGAGVDSFYEYLIKSYILFGDPYFYSFFQDLYPRVMSATRIEDVHLQAHIHSGDLIATWTDSLGAFWPGMQVLVGDVAHAQAGFLRFWAIWRRYGIGLPERYDIASHVPIDAYHHLRPELIESAYMLFTATKDPFYIHAGATMMDSYERYAKVNCGYASIKNVASKEKEDKMESFFLSETLKYLYLLFTPDHWMNKENWVFSTEAHPFPVDQPWRRAHVHTEELPSATCAIQEPCRFTFDQMMCPYNNSLYLRPSRKYGTRPPLLHFVLDGLRHADVQGVGANILPSDREIIVTVRSSVRDIQSYYSIRAAFGSPIFEDSSVTSPLIRAVPHDACKELDNSDVVKGHIVVIDRGDCTFAQKAINAERAGAVGALFINNHEGTPFTMTDDRYNPSGVNIPLTLLSKDDGQRVLNTMAHHMKSGSAPPSATFAAAHPYSEDGIIQIVMNMRPSVPKERHPPVGLDKGNLAYRFADTYVIMSPNQSDHIYAKHLEGSAFQMFIRNETAPFSISRVRL